MGSWGDWGGTKDYAWHVLTGDFMLQLGWEEPAGQRSGAGDLRGCLRKVARQGQDQAGSQNKAQLCD